ncbi:LysR family transcriptional regulator [Paraburkholderia sp. EG285A]|uniref:LysR family transcriptional regulator n=1 Tax=Paraburkholderia sp. EG285A TaxID=3237009 RepID=UPI0034D3590A
MKHLDTETLSVLVSVAELGSFTLAAEKLGKTQAAVSISISRLEEKIGKKLLERTHKGVIPTASGVRLLEYAYQIHKIESEALEAMMSRAGDTRIRLGMPDDYIKKYGGALQEQFRSGPGNVYIDLTCDFSKRLRCMVEAGALDIALVADEDVLSGEFLGYEKQVWCCAPNSTPENSNPLELALFSDECLSRPNIFSCLNARQLSWRLAYSSSHIAGIYLAVTSGNLLTVLPECAVPCDWRRVEDGRLPEISDLRLAILTSKSAHFQARKVARFLLQKFGQPQAASGRAVRETSLQ